jgi:hypothetical protein
MCQPLEDVSDVSDVSVEEDLPLSLLEATWTTTDAAERQLLDRLDAVTYERDALAKVLGGLLEATARLPVQGNGQVFVARTEARRVLAEMEAAVVLAKGGQRGNPV